MPNEIHIKGARVHNLKNVELKLPRDKFIVITGLSGSGKSSLAFDTIYAEGQRRYVESLSTYARQFLGQVDKPDVDFIEGLSPAISIDQKTRSKNPRSTVGTVTEIYDYLRLLYAHIGKVHCPNCGKTVAKQTVQEIVDKIMDYKKETKIIIMAPVIRGRKGEYKKLFEDLKKKGYARVRVDGTIVSLEDNIRLKKNEKHSIEVVVDRTVVKKENYKRIFESLETALKEGEHLVDVIRFDGKKELIENYSELFACLDCDISIPEILPRSFSFNSPFGACEECKGLGEKFEFDIAKVVPDPSLSLAQGAIEPWRRQMNGFRGQMVYQLAEHYKFDMRAPFEKLPEKIKNILLYGTSDQINYKWESKYKDSTWEYKSGFEGILHQLERLYNQTESEERRDEMRVFMSVKECPTCKGKKLNKYALGVTLGKKNITEVTELPITELKMFFSQLTLSDKEKTISKQILKEINERLSFMLSVGLGYLSLDRRANTLSGGESQRIRLATQIGSGLVGVLYVLDEPSIGLHQRDNIKLLNSLKRLRDLGNTLIVVEHDEETIRSADYVVDIGPGAGKKGGKIVYSGPLSGLKKAPKSLTAEFLNGNRFIKVPDKRREGNGKIIKLSGAEEHNLKKLNVEFPLGKLIAVTGVSGSGKSTLVSDTLHKVLAKELYKAKDKPGKYKNIEGVENIDKVIVIDQAPIGRTPRSNPATYTGLFTPIRELFSMTPEAKIRGYKPGRFSFNVRGGRCEACEGDGVIKIEMHFLPDVYVQCDVCKGKRFNKETLEVNYKGCNIADVLDMTVAEAQEVFKNIPVIEKKLRTLKDVGLDYIHLGQPATTLSGGEAQRVKLSTELSKRATGRTFYMLDEPTTGLHFADIQNLLNVLDRLVDKGNTVVVVEHNLDVIKTADHIIDLGPEGGGEGGYVIAKGSPEEVVKIKRSFTGKYLLPLLKTGN